MKQQLISLFFCGVLLLQGCTEKKNEAQLEKTLSVYQVDLKSESPKESIDSISGRYGDPVVTFGVGRQYPV